MLPGAEVAISGKDRPGVGGAAGKYDGSMRIAIAADHATLSEAGQHAADPVPVVIWGDGIEPDEVQAYDEQSVSKGALKRFPLQHLLGNLFQLS